MESTHVLSFSQRFAWPKIKPKPTLLSISQSLASRQIIKNNQISLLPTSAVSNFFMLSVSFCFRLSEAFNSTIQTKKLKIQTCILNTAENLFDRCGENKKYFRHIFRLMKKFEFYFTLFTSRSKCFLSILTIERVTTSLI